MSSPSPTIDEEGMCVYVDDNGVPVEAAAEGSFLMAEGLLMEMEMRSGSSEALAFTPYVPDFDVTARQAEAAAFFARHDARVAMADDKSSEEEEEEGEEPAASGATASSKPPSTQHHTATECVPVVAASKHRPTQDTHPRDRKLSPEGAAEECDGEEDDEGFAVEEGEEDYDDEDVGDDEVMSSGMGSRCVTDPADWTLESIHQRRVNKDPKGEGGPWIYLCKWKGHAERTWELRGVLEEAGWIPQVDAFDARGVATKDRTLKMKDADYGKCKRLFRTKDNVKKTPKNRRRAPESPMKAIEDFFGPNCDAVWKAVRAGCGNHTIYQWARMNPAFAVPFLARWRACSATHVPTIVFHGTRSANLQSIYNRSLLVGGSGVKMVNGNVHGAGIYTARSSSTPMYYTMSSPCLIACVGLVPITPTTSVRCVSNSEVIVFSNPEDLLPMWLISYCDLIPSESDGFPELIPAEYRMLSFPEMLSRASIFEKNLNAHNMDPVFNGATIAALNRRYLNNLANAAVSTPAHTDEEKRARIAKALACAGGGISKATLKAQPRHIRELLLAHKQK